MCIWFGICKIIQAYYCIRPTYKIPSVAPGLSLDGSTRDYLWDAHYRVDTQRECFKSYTQALEKKVAVWGAPAAGVARHQTVPMAARDQMWITQRETVPISAT